MQAGFNHVNSKSKQIAFGNNVEKHIASKLLGGWQHCECMGPVQRLSHKHDKHDKEMEVLLYT